MRSAVTEEYAKELLNIHGATYSKPEVLTAFRAYVFLHHQDKSNHAVDMDAAVKSKELLLTTCADYAASTEFRLIDGTPLRELGNGVPFPKSGKECSGCGGKGYNKYTYQPTIRCGSCNGRGFISRAPTVRLGGFIDMCRRCRGHGNLRSAKSEVNYMRCDECEGHGEVEIFNPLLPKFRIVGT